MSIRKSDVIEYLMEKLSECEMVVVISTVTYLAFNQGEKPKPVHVIDIKELLQKLDHDLEMERIRDSLPDS